MMRKGLDQWLDKLILKFRAPKWEGETVVTVRLKKRRSKSVSRFFYKPKKKTKYDILKDKMVVLDKEIKKTMPDM